MAKWTAADMPDQTGRTVLVTGGNSGLGLQSAVVLASRGARVLLACRSRERGEQALDQVRQAGKAELITLDLADLSSVRTAAAEIRERTGDQLDVLMNNAGVMATPARFTIDGFELQFGTNHLGHAALTWLLMPALRGRSGARVVTLSSLAHKGRGLDLNDPNFEQRSYTPSSAYSQSKLANLLFAFELDRRLRAADLNVISVAAHPGLSNTELFTTMARSTGNSFYERGARVFNALFTQRVEKGALPQLYAATAVGVEGGQYYGPNGLAEYYGYPKLALARPIARSPKIAVRLWDLTARMTGVAPDPS